MASPPSKLWRLLPHDRDKVEQLARTLQLTPIVAQLLLNRGVQAPEVARRFLDGALTGLHPPNLLPGVPEAVERLFAAIEAGKTICIYGDYDVDGVTGSAILIQALRLLGAKPEFYVPRRIEEGYGLNRDALKHLAGAGVHTVVTVDCGIASLQEADEAKRLGLELIITDHHEMKDELPRASVLIHPRLPGTSYPFGMLCGAAVAFKLAWALAMHKCGGEKVTPELREMLLDGVALAALGVVADVVPLQDENRIIVRHGLTRLRNKPSLGLQALCEVAGLGAGSEIKASHIGFQLAPRINAVGRLGEAKRAVELLTTAKRDRALALARECESLNESRKLLERDTVERAKKLIEAEGHGSAPALVLASDDWHGGIVGIVAARLAETYGRPTLMITLPQVGANKESLHGRLAVGSGRSIAGLPLHEALKSCGELLHAHGGHAMAAGFRLPVENVNAFRVRFCEHVAGHYPGGVPRPELVLDAEAPLGALTMGLVNELDKLEPYGANNRKPLFLASGLRVEGEPRKVGKEERHLSFRVRQGPIVLKAIAWNMADRVAELMADGGACSLAFTPERNEWQGRVTIDLKVSDFQSGADTQLS